MEFYYQKISRTPSKKYSVVLLAADLVQAKKNSLQICIQLKQVWYFVVRITLI